MDVTYDTIDRALVAPNAYFPENGSQNERKNNIKNCPYRRDDSFVCTRNGSSRSGNFMFSFDTFRFQPPKGKPEKQNSVSPRIFDKIRSPNPIE
jgi:hypothetical protein